MILADILDFQRRIFRKSWLWGALLPFAAAVGVYNLLSRNPALLNSSVAWLAAFGEPFLRVCLFCLLAPAAWMWDGKEDGHPSLGRSLVQSLLFSLLTSAACTSILLLEFHHFGVPIRTSYLWGALGSLLYQLPIFALVGHFVVTQDKALMAQAEAERKAREAQWVHLKGQLSPEVFFGAMDHLETLVEAGAPEAEQAVVDLTELFRLLMEHGSKPLTFLGEEKRLVERYLAVERLRLGDRLELEWDWDADLDAVYAPPFLLQSVVEDALSRASGPVRLHISGCRSEGIARLRISRDGRLVEAADPCIANLQARLSLAFEDDASCRVLNEGEWSVVESTIPILPEIR